MTSTLLECFQEFMKIEEKNRPKVENQSSKSYDSKEGCISFWWSPNELIIYTITVEESLRRKGLFTALLLEISKHPDVKKICIAAVGSWALTDLLGKLIIDEKGFCCHGGDYCWFQDGKCPRGHDQVAKKLTFE
jgi:hypothetical protein